MGLLDSLRVRSAQTVFSPWQGMGNDNWHTQLRLNKGRIDPSFLPRALLISVSAPVNSWFRRRVNQTFRDQLQQAQLLPPLFILGHWRSGTTHLQRLFALDERFAWPNLYQCMYPGGFLLSENRNRAFFNAFLPKSRLFDSMGNTMADAAEDEFALCTWCGLSSYMGWAFPQRWHAYTKYLTLEDVSDLEFQTWKETFFAFAKRLAVRYPGKPLIFKSPPHTARLKILADLFPNAKFLHIHRHPHVVYSSTKKMHATFLKSTQMQHDDLSNLENRIVEAYADMHRCYFRDKERIEAHRLMEIRYDDLDQHPLDTMQRIYQTLDLPDFDQVKPAMQDYLQSVSNYKKNRYDPLPLPLQQRLHREWSPLVAPWNYDLTPSDKANA